jgi:hypothetical protein
MTILAAIQTIMEALGIFLFMFVLIWGGTLAEWALQERKTETHEIHYASHR